MQERNERKRKRSRKKGTKATTQAKEEIINVTYVVKDTAGICYCLRALLLFAVLWLATSLSM